MNDAYVLIMQIGTQRCALAASYVREVLRPLPISPCPGHHPALRGMMTLRGTPCPVIDVPTLLDVHTTQPCAHVVHATISGRSVALLVHAVIGVRRDVAFATTTTWPAENLGRLGFVQHDHDIVLLLRELRLPEEVLPLS